MFSFKKKNHIEEFYCKCTNLLSVCEKMINYEIWANNIHEMFVSENISFNSTLQTVHE